MGMKKIFIAIAVPVLLIACNNDDTSTESTSKQESEKKLSLRDMGINSTNSYSNLFFDSTVLETFIVDKKIDDTLARRMRSFYNTRNYQFAWFSSNGLTEQARGFWNLHDYVMAYEPDSSLVDKKLQKRMDNLLTEDDLSVSASDKTYLNTELTLTQHFILYMLHNYDKGYVKRKEMERFIPRKKEDALVLADSLINKKHKDDKYFEDVNQTYKALKDQLTKYLAIAKKGDWPQVNPIKKSLKKGKQFTENSNNKKNITRHGRLDNRLTTSQLFSDTLELAVKSFQERFGYTPTGVITDSLIKQMNVPAKKRVQQILMNMDRMRWLASEPKGNLIVVNIPEFVLHVYESGQKSF
jgi:murein L,D-transpeptidase YcbB/YkuD